MRELVSVSQLSDPPLDGKEKVYSFSIYYWREDGQVYFVEHPGKNADINTLQGTAILRDAMFDRWENNLQEASYPLPDDVYLKQTLEDSYLTHPHPDHTFLVDEALVLQRLQHHSHPNMSLLRRDTRW